MGHRCQLEAGTEARGEVRQVLDRCTSMQETPHTASQLHLPGSITSSSVRRMTENELGSAYLGALPPIFFINIITSDSLNPPFASIPIVSWVLPNTWGTARETKSPRRLE